MQQGDSLANIASRRYGSMYYSKLISVHNQIKNPNKVNIGDKFKTPGLTELMTSTGVTAGAPQPVADLLLAIAHFRLAGPEFTAARAALAAAPANPKTKKKPRWAVPESVRARLSETARLLESSAAALGALAPGEKVQAAPKTAVSQITAAANQVKYLAAGGALDKSVQRTEVGTVDQLISGAIGNLILWAQGGYK